MLIAAKMCETDGLFFAQSFSNQMLVRPAKLLISLREATEVFLK